MVVHLKSGKFWGTIQEQIFSSWILTVLIYLHIQTFTKWCIFSESCVSSNNLCYHTLRLRAYYFLPILECKFLTPSPKLPFKKKKKKKSSVQLIPSWVFNANSVQSLSCVQLFATPWIATPRASLSITNSWTSLKLTSIKSVMPSSHLILY